MQFWTTCGLSKHTYHLPSAFVLLLEFQMCRHLQGMKATEWNQNRWPATGQTHSATTGPVPQGLSRQMTEEIL